MVIPELTARQEPRVLEENLATPEKLDHRELLVSLEIEARLELQDKTAAKERKDPRAQQVHQVRRARLETA